MFNKEVIIICLIALISFSNEIMASSDFIQACKDGNITVVKQLIEAGVDVNYQSAHNKTGLMYAAQRGHIAIVKLILKQKNIKLTYDSFGNSAQSLAKDNNHTQIVTLLNKLVKKHNATKALQTYVKDGNVEKVTESIAQGANINVKDQFGQTPLMYAIQANNLKIIELLIKHKAELNFTCKINNNSANERIDPSPLALAIENDNIDIVNILLKHGADPNLSFTKYFLTRTKLFGMEPERVGEAECNYTPLALAIQKGYDAIALKLIQHGANINAEICNHIKPFFIAVAFGRTTVVEKLIEKGADVNEVSSFGDPTLVLAVAKGKYDVARLLLKNKAIVTAENSNNDTAITFAFRNKNYDFVKYLLTKGADVNKAFNNKKGEEDTYLNYLIRKGDLQSIKYFVKNGVDINSEVMPGVISPLGCAMENNKTKIFKYLLNKKADWKYRCYDKQGNNAITFFLKKKNDKLLKYFIKHIDIDDYSDFLNEQNDNYETPLNIAVYNNDFKWVKWLVTHGAKYGHVIEIAEDQENSEESHNTKVKQPPLDPLLYAIKTGKTKIAKYLINNVSDDYVATDREGHSLITVAVISNDIEITKLLIKKNYSLELIDNDENISAFSYALMKSNDQMIQFLMTQKAIQNEIEQDAHNLIGLIILRKDIKLVKQFLKKITSNEEIESKAFAAALRSGNMKLINIFSKNIPDEDWICFLGDAAASGKLKLVKIVLNKSKNKNLNDFDDHTKSPVMCAAEKGHLHIVKFLINKGAKFDQCDEEGNTALDYARKNGHMNIVKYLRSKGAK